MQMSRRDPLFQAKPKVLRKPHQLLHTPFHLIHEIDVLGPQVVINAVPKNRRQSHTSPRRLLVREPYAPQEPNLRSQRLRSRVQKMGVQVSGRAQILHPQLPQVIESWPETELDVGEENAGAAEDHAAGLFGGSGEVGGQEVEDWSDVGGLEGGGEEQGAEEGEASEVGVGEALGLEEVYGGEDVVDFVRRGRLLVVFGGGVEYAEGSEVTEVVAVGCAEFEVERFGGGRGRERVGGWDFGERGGREGCEGETVKHCVVRSLEGKCIQVGRDGGVCLW